MLANLEFNSILYYSGQKTLLINGL